MNVDELLIHAAPPLPFAHPGHEWSGVIVAVQNLGRSKPHLVLQTDQDFEAGYGALRLCSWPLTRELTAAMAEAGADRISRGDRVRVIFHGAGEWEAEYKRGVE